MGVEEQRKILSNLLERLKSADTNYFIPKASAHLSMPTIETSASIGYNRIFIMTFNTREPFVNQYRITDGSSSEINARVDSRCWDLVELPINGTLKRPTIVGQIYGAESGEEVHFTSFA